MTSLIKKLTNEIDRLLGGQLTVLGNSDDLPEFKRDPNLEDIMRAIEKKGIDSEQQHIYILSKFIFGRHSLWQLGKSLSQQSDKTIEKIAEILGI